jgi:hypothetical protein
MFSTYVLIAIFFIISIVIGKEAASFAGAGVLIFGLLPSIYFGLFSAKKYTSSPLKIHSKKSC